MRTTGNRTSRLTPVITATLVFFLAAGAVAFQGCGKDQAKQDFVNRVLDIMRENQSHPEIAEEGTVAFQDYYQSGFKDLESAARAEESFARSNEKDERTLQSLEEMEKPDQEASAIVEKLSAGIEIMDEGNSLNAAELEKAPQQSVEERSRIFDQTAEAMSYYLEGLDYIIQSFGKLLEYVEANELEGAQEVRDWLEKFNQEKESVEQAMQSMSAAS